MSSFMIENLLSNSSSSTKRKLNTYEESENKRPCIFNYQRIPFQTLSTNFNQLNYNTAFYSQLAASLSAAVYNTKVSLDCSLNSSGYSSARSNSPVTNHTSLISESEENSNLENIYEDEEVQESNQIVKKKLKREKRDWSCETCNKVFDRPSLLERHIRTHTGEKPHVCDVCGKAFSTSSSLNTHVRIHSGEKPHECNICGKKFTASSNLYYHKLTHTSEKPHKCSECTKSFSTPGDLRAHMHIHNGTWPFKCDICSKGFTKQTNLKNHILIHTGAKPFSCTKCDKQFSLACNLKSHIKTHHGCDENQ